MAILKIARMGNPILLRECDPVPDPGAPEIRRLVADMMLTMEDAPGVGLAAPQVYVPLRLFVFRVPAERASADPNSQGVPNTVLINPEFEAIGEETGLNWEGCLSIPEMRAVVPRALHIRYRGVDCDGNVIEGEAHRFHARVIQHEYDHLDGILYPMRVTDFRFFGFNQELDRAVEAQRQQREAAEQREADQKAGEQPASEQSALQRQGSEQSAPQRPASEQSAPQRQGSDQQLPESWARNPQGQQ